MEIMSFNFRPLLNKFRVYAILNNFIGRLRKFVVLFKQRFYTRIRQRNRVKFEFKSITFTMLPSTGRYQLFNYLYLLLVITTIHSQGEKIFIAMGKCNFNDPTPKRKCWTKLVRLFLEENYTRNHQHFEKR